MKWIVLLSGLSLLVLNCAAVKEEFSPPQEAAITNLPAEMLEAVNRLRVSGCRCGSRKMAPAPPLDWDTRLASAAQRHAADMNKRGFFDHRGSDGSKVSSRARDAGFNWRHIGENIAYDYGNVAEVVSGWQDSPAHCRNLMSPDFRSMGAAYEGGYWVQVLGAE